MSEYDTQRTVFGLSAHGLPAIVKLTDLKVGDGVIIISNDPEDFSSDDIDTWQANHGIVQYVGTEHPEFNVGVHVAAIKIFFDHGNRDTYHLTGDEMPVLDMGMAGSYPAVVLKLPGEYVDMDVELEKLKIDE